MVQIKFLFMFLFTILLLGSVNALDLDNYKVYNETIGNYGKIEVWENEFISSDYKISDYTLIEHKSDMFTGYSKIKVKVFEESRLMDNIFEKNNKEIETLNIKFSRITYENKPKQIRVCEIKSSININSSEEYFYNDCNYVFNYSDMEEKEIVEEINYNMGDDIIEGEYFIEFFGKRNSMNTGMYDWIFETMGIETPEWASWWNTAYTYEKIINITNNMNDLVVKKLTTISMTVNTQELINAGKMQVNCDDLRIVYNESSERNRIITSCNSTTTNVLFSLISNISVSSSDTSFYKMYYGNTLAVNPPENDTGSKVYIYKDSLTSDLGGWTKTGTATFGLGGLDLGSDVALMSKQMNFSDNMVMTGQMKNDGGDNWAGVAMRTTSTSYSYGTGITTAQSRSGWGLDGVNSDTGVSISTGTFYTFTVTYDRGTATMNYNGANKVHTMLNGDNALNFSAGAIVSTSIVVKDLLIRSNYYNTPTATLGDETILMISTINTILTSPTNNSIIRNSYDFFNVSSVPLTANLTNALIIVSNSTSEYYKDLKLLSGNNTIESSWEITGFNDGVYTWNVTTNGTNDVGDVISEISETWNFEVDLTLPELNVTYPSGIITYLSNGQSVDLNWTVSDANLDSCWYDYNGSIQIVTCGDNTTTFNFETGNNNLTFYVNDSVGNTQSQFKEFTFLFEKYNIVYNNLTFEGNQESFDLNLALSGGNLISEALFNYAGINYTTTIAFASGEYDVSSKITVPLTNTNTNNSFNFFITVGGIIYNLETFNQSVIDVNISESGIDNDTLINMSLFDEELRTSLIGDIEINIQAISKTSGSTIATFQSTSSGISSSTIYLSPKAVFDDLYLDAEIRYSSGGYEPEFYYIQKADMSDYPINLSLFDLNSNDSTDFLIKYQDNSLIAVEGAIVQLLRKYISTDEFETVEAPKTGNIGTAKVHIDLDTNNYKAIVVKDGIILDIFENIVFDCESELTGLCTQNLFGKIDSQNSVPVTIINDFAYSISSVNDTVTTTFSIPSGTSSDVKIIVNQKDMFGTKEICNQSVTSSAGSVDCGYNTTIGDSNLQITILKNDQFQAIEEFSVDESGGIDWLDNNYFIVLILLLSLVGMGVSSPEWMIVNGVLTIVLSGGLWLLNGFNFVMGLGGLVWLIIIAIILIFKLAKQEDR